ncbi:CBS domain-containing protein [uncultured Selenomonas sp.]|jgi:CBS domain protein/ACT domain-containing protein|uniref:CBS domain-containing protein n=1 Tax=uncultured Selenomonas sp. TaxID=159275 RepID=UPI001CB543DF|nr:CBS domain-containing protein [uncultured Selenomonas sp.]MBF1684417.1 CBS domain-containing protein [Selenomonas sp.]MBF1685693.1 CBS domain-containing protein [Selenomonas sp.]MBF1687660.1 CBS domain-containing protein [Selenomonas sp.]MBF1691350.1 CBS domain-containing protein [Selenomonas sp.]MBF1695970.1 CBS domain-containing protein [Selenomonas sp.]
MFVANCMTKNPITIAPDVGIDEAAKIMDKGHFRRLPVVEHGKLVGFFTNRDLLRASPSAATTLDRFEMRTLLSKIKVADVMQKNVITVTDTTTIEEAALVMAREKIGGMPVLSEVGKVVGIISSTDIFRAFVTVMGLDSGKTRLTIAVADRKGVLRDIATVLADLDINIDSMVTIPQPSGTYDIIIRADIADVETVKERLAAKGFTVSHVTQIG